LAPHSERTSAKRVRRGVGQSSWSAARVGARLPQRIAPRAFWRATSQRLFFCLLPQDHLPAPCPFVKSGPLGFPAISGRHNIALHLEYATNSLRYMDPSNRVTSTRRLAASNLAHPNMKTGRQWEA